MPQNLTDTAVFTDPIVAPVDTDVRNVASVVPSFQGLANRTRHLLRAHGAYGGLCIADGVGGSTFLAPPQYPTYTAATWWNAALPSDAAGIIVPNLGADGLFVTEAGVYEVHARFYVQVHADTEPDIYRVAIGVAGVPSTELTEVFDIPDTATAANVSLSGIVVVGEDELVTVRVAASGASGGLRVGAGSFWMRRLA